VPTYVALLRGVNLGPHKKVSMPALRELCEELGHASVTTYIQSGNVVFTSGTRSAAKVAAELTDAIAGTFGHDVPVMIRTPRRLAAIIAENPFLARGEPTKPLAVAFLGDEPPAAAINELDPDRSPPDEFVVAGREVYLLYPNGLGRSKLTHDYLERRLGTTATIRNWNTVTKLLELARAV
jgi:uncharacterized protein (DUF1697 family)